MGTPKATPATADAFLARLEARSSPVERDKLQRSFDVGEDADPTGDVVLGVRMGEVFALAKEFIDLPPGEIDQLLASPIHQVRAGALSIMGDRGRLPATGDPQLGDDVGDVEAGGLRDEQGMADLPVGPPLGDQGEDLSLTLGQAE